MRCKSLLLLSMLLVAAAMGCGDDSSASPDGGASTEDGSRPTIVVTTSILGDVVANLVGERASVEVVMPPGASPHEFQASARQVAAMRTADALIVNGAGFEEGLIDVIQAARQDGVATYQAIDAVQTLALGQEAGHPHAAEETPGHAADDDEDELIDPHFFTDPLRTAAAARGIVDFLAETVPELDQRGGEALRSDAAPYVAQLEQVDREAENALSVVPPDRRKLVTNHEAFGYFADRYRFEVLGAVIPGGGTQAAASAGALDELAAVIREAQVKAIFADTSSPEQLAAALAAEVGDVKVIELYSESLGPPGSPGATYLDMVGTNAARIAAALAG